jgi:hypothetical protein
MQQPDVEDNHYVYAYVRETASQHGAIGSFYYIGKGKGRRARNRLGRITMPNSDRSNVVILADGMTKEDALQAEIFLISAHGRIDKGTGCLRNLTDGGIGSRGYTWTQCQLSKLKGRERIGRTEASRRRTSQALMGHPVSEETRMKQRLAKLGKKQSELALLKKRGAVRSEQTKQNMRAAMIRHWELKRMAA